MKTTYHKAKAGLLAILLLGLALLLCGCRVRTTGEEENPISPEASERLMAGLSGGPSGADAPPEEDPNPGEETDELSSQTRENPSASRKEYDENAPAEIVPGTDRLLHTEGQGAGAPLPEEESSRSVSQLKHYADEMLENTGLDEISLSSLSSSDYTNIGEIVRYLIDTYASRHINIQLPSLRIDAFSLDVMSRIQDVRKSSLTFAPEAGSQRLRDVINKGLTEEVILHGAREAFRGGWSKVKLYFMLGLPGETEEDRKAIAHLANEIAAAYYDEVPKEKRQGKCRFVQQFHSFSVISTA